MKRSVHPALIGAIVALFAQSAPVRAQMSQSDMVVRLDQLESDVRRLTGAVEELQYRNQRLEQALRQTQAGGAPGPGAAPAAPMMAPAGPAPAGPAVAPGGPPAMPGRRSDVFDPTQSPNAPGAPRVLGSMPGSPGAPYGERPPAPPAPIAEAPGGYPGNADAGPRGGSQIGAPLDLGTMSAGAANDAAAGPGGGQPPRYPAGPQLATLPPTQTPKDEFDLAYGYVLRKDYALAAQSFQEFLRKYPSDRMASEAQFWLGESLFQGKNFQSAAEAFVTMTKKFTASPKQPDTLLRLGQSLAALQQKDLACATYSEVAKKFPHAAQNVRAAVEREQKRVRC